MKKLLLPFLFTYAALIAQDAVLSLDSKVQVLQQPALSVSADAQSLVIVQTITNSISLRQLRAKESQLTNQLSQVKKQLATVQSQISVALAMGIPEPTNRFSASK